MGLPGGKKTATGAWSTTASVLEDLAAEGHQLPARVLEWRQLSKLKSTYTDALPGFVNPRPAACTRPTRSPRRRPAGCRRPSPICRTFRSAPRKAARSAAPSSRRRATSSSRPTTARSSCACSPISPISRRSSSAFADGLDIHAMTASEMFGVPIEGMPAKSAGAPRRSISASSTASRPSASPTSSASRARRRAPTSRKYFERFPGIRDYMEATKKTARAERLCHDAVRPQMPLSAHQRLQPVRARLQRARRDQRAAAGLRRRHHQPRHGPHGRRARARRA